MSLPLTTRADSLVFICDEYAENQLHGRKGTYGFAHLVYRSVIIFAEQGIWLVPSTTDVVLEGQAETLSDTVGGPYNDA
jgi:hypothetical protein